MCASKLNALFCRERLEGADLIGTGRRYNPFYG
jgi:hypothetical protein